MNTNTVANTDAWMLNTIDTDTENRTDTDTRSYHIPSPEVFWYRLNTIIMAWFQTHRNRNTSKR